MSNTYTKIYIHYIFSTKHRRPLIKPEYEEKLWSYLGGIAQKHHMIPTSISGTTDHIHGLFIIPPTLSVAKGVQLLKGGSSKWMNDHHVVDRSFKWQKGYGAFSVSESRVPAVTKYIKNQKEHHRELSFKEEYLGFLKEYRIKYDKRYIFD
jgi:REP element-mobilizing transposase RayT